MATLNFNAQNVNPQAIYEPLPAGWYPVAITASESRPTKNGQGAYLHLELTVLDGTHKGRKVYDRLNLWNQNQVATEIAYRQLSAICHAVGVLEVGDSVQLHNLPLEAKVSIRAADGAYEASNEVKGYRAATSPAQPAAPVHAPASAPAAPVTPPPAAPVAPTTPAAPITAPTAPAAPAPAPTAPTSFPWANA